MENIILSMEYHKAILLVSLLAVTRAALIYSAPSTHYFGSPYYMSGPYMPAHSTMYPYRTNKALRGTSASYPPVYSGASYQPSPYGTSYNTGHMTTSSSGCGSQQDPQGAFSYSSTQRAVSSQLEPYVEKPYLLDSLN